MSKYRDEKWFCPTCKEILVPSIGNAADGEPNRMWCTSSTCVKKAYNHREVELIPLDPSTTTAKPAEPTTATSSDTSPDANTTTASKSAPAPSTKKSSPEKSSTKTSSTPSKLLDFQKLEDKKKKPLVHQFQLIKAAFARSRLVLLYGPPGTGKSSIAATLLTGGRDISGLTLTPETPMAEMRGSYVLKGGDMVWQDGPGIRAWRHGHRLILDEVNHAGPDVISFLYALLDDAWAAKKKGYILPTGERVEPVDTYQVVCTMNGNPDRLPEAIADRLNVAVHVKYPMPEIIEHLPDDLKEPALNSILDGKTGARPWLNLDNLRQQYHKEDDLSWQDANILAGTLIFGDNWNEMAADIKIGTSPEPK